MVEGDILHCPWACEFKDDGKFSPQSRHWIEECKGNPQAKNKVGKK